MLNNHYNVTNSTNLVNDLTKLEVHENHRMITFNIKDLYIYIPIDETLNIIKNKTIAKHQHSTNTSNSFTIKGNPITDLLYFPTKSINQKRASPWDHRFLV
jgi:hypothetical protein